MFCHVKYCFILKLECLWFRLTLLVLFNFTVRLSPPLVSFLTYTIQLISLYFLIFELPRLPSDKESACQCRRCKRLEFSIPELGRSPGVGNGNPLQCFYLENSMTEEPGGLLSVGLRRVGYRWAHCAVNIYIPHTKKCII